MKFYNVFDQNLESIIIFLMLVLIIVQELEILGCCVMHFDRNSLQYIITSSRNNPLTTSSGMHCLRSILRFLIMKSLSSGL
jgi:hypothetical protein